AEEAVERTALPPEAPQEAGQAAFAQTVPVPDEKQPESAVAAPPPEPEARRLGSWLPRDGKSARPARAASARRDALVTYWGLGLARTFAPVKLPVRQRSRGSAKRRTCSSRSTGISLSPPSPSPGAGSSVTGSSPSATLSSPHPHQPPPSFPRT